MVRAALAALAVLLAGSVGHLAAAAGLRWAADDAVSRGMAVIRKATLDHHTLVTHRRLSPTAAAAFANALSREAARIKSEARLPEDAARALDVLLDEIVTAGEAVAGRNAELTPIDGIIKIDAALSRYPQHFDDPKWLPLR